MCECSFVKALVWSVGGCIDGASRPGFNDYLRALISGKSGPHPAHADFLSKNRTYDQASFGGRSMLLPPDFGGEGKEVCWGSLVVV